ncbi:MAG: hypothetical protein R2718_04350 [Solirubrobacterales bacterium]
MLAVVLVAAGAFWAATSIGAEDPRQAGAVAKVESHADGSSSIYREQEDGLVVVEHREVDGETWFESNEVLGEDGEPIVCPDGRTLKVDLDAEVQEPTAEEFFKARRDLPEDKTLAFNEYTGELEVVDVVRVEQNGISMPTDPLIYQCGPNNEPVLVHLSEVDPEAAAEVRREAVEQLDDVSGEGGILEDFGGDPANDFPQKAQP